MKTLNTKSMLVGTVLSVASLAGGSAWGAPGSIVGSAHDFSGDAWSGGQICVVCHAPHGGQVVVDAPLWNHELSAETNYALYTSPTFQGKATQSQPDGVSKLCLSCHDGTVAPDSFGGATGTAAKLTPPLAVAGDTEQLSNDHPISFVYDTTLSGSDEGLFNPTTTQVTTGSTKTQTGSIQDVLLRANKVQCVSCHDVHNTYTVADVASSGKLLRISLIKSKLCLTCHDK